MRQDIHPRIPFDHLPKSHRRRVVYALSRLQALDQYQATLLMADGMTHDPVRRIRLHIHIANVINYISGMPLRGGSR